MPEQSKHRRGSGASIVAGVREKYAKRRAYTAADAGASCTVCSFPLVRALSDNGDTTHPTCDPEHVELLEALTRTIRRHGTEDTMPPTAAPPEPPPTITTPASPGSITDKQLRKLHATYAEAGIIQRDGKLAFAARFAGRSVDSTRDLSQHEAGHVIDALDRHLRGEGL